MNWDKVFEKAVAFMFSVGFVWVAAYWFNPDINSNTVWFVAILYAALSNQIIYPSEDKNDR